LSRPRCSYSSAWRVSALALADEQRTIVHEASQVIRMLEAEGSAVTFSEVFTLVRDDRRRVQRRLNGADAGKATQAIQEDIIDTLPEMSKSLGKAIGSLAPPRSG
jgi:hypothetical protein